MKWEGLAFGIQKIFYLKMFCILPRRDLEDLKITDFRSFLAWRADQKISKASSARGVSALKNFFRFLMRDVEHVEETGEGVLSVQAGIDQPAFFISPFGKTAVIKAFL